MLLNCMNVKKVEKLVRNIETTTNYLDEESLSLATDLKQLKNREERLRRVTDDALNHGEYIRCKCIY